MPGLDTRYGMKTAVVKLHQCFTKEKNHLQECIEDGIITDAQILTPYQNVNNRVHKALGVKERTVENIMKEFRTKGKIEDPTVNRKSCGRIPKKADSFLEGVIRRVVLGFYSDKSIPTLRMIHNKLKEDLNFPEMSLSTLWKIIRQQLKFRFVKTKNRPIPLERADIAAARKNYLQMIQMYREAGYKIFYQDETWISVNSTKGKGWYIPEVEVLGMGNAPSHLDIWLRGIGHRFADGLLGGFESWPSGAGRRIVINHIGSENGFLKGAGEAFMGAKNPKDPDYHSEMNSVHFNNWFKGVIDLLPNKSVVILDQATYHRVKVEETKNPRSNWRKQSIIDWLIKKDVPIPMEIAEFKDLTKPKLMTLAKQYHGEEVFVVDSLVQKSGKDIKIIWSPVAHCELNLIELIWAKLKGTVIAQNKTPKHDAVLSLTKTVITDLEDSEQGKKLWYDCVKHVRKLEDLLKQREKSAATFIEATVTPLIIPVYENDTTDSEDSGSDIGSDEEESDDASVTVNRQTEGGLISLAEEVTTFEMESDETMLLIAECDALLNS